MSDAPKYLTGAWKHQPRKTPTPPNRPYTPTPIWQMFAIAAFCLVAIALAHFGTDWVHGYIADQIEVGVTRD